MSAKSFAIANQMYEALKTKFATVTMSTDTNGNSDISVGDLSDASQSALVRVTSVAQIGKDIVGNTQTTYSPCLVQIVMQQTDAENGTLVLFGAAAFNVLSQALKFGCQTELYYSAKDVAITSAAITGAAKATFFGSDEKFKQMGSM
jgi:hypothetical protein